MMTKLPGIVLKAGQYYDAWIVGGAAKPDADIDKVRDIDVVVPFRNWKHVAALLPRTARPNTFGGWKIHTETGHDVDIWPDDIDTLMSVNMCKHLWHMRTGMRWSKS